MIQRLEALRDEYKRSPSMMVDADQIVGQIDALIASAREEGKLWKCATCRREWKGSWPLEHFPPGVEEPKIYSRRWRMLCKGAPETTPPASAGTEGTGLREAWKTLRPWVVNLSDALSRTDVKRNDGLAASDVIHDSVTVIDLALQGGKAGGQG